MSTSATSTTYFNGTSTFSGDLQNVISKAVTIASLPIQQLNNDVSTLTSEQSALSSMSTTFSTLQAAVAGIDTAVGSGSYSVASSDSTVATASAGAGALFGAYTLRVTDPGSQSSAVSTAAVTNPTTQSISASSSFTLVANGQTYSNITPPPGTSTLTSLVTAINTATDGAVQATVVNVGTASAPSYELSVQNTAYGALPITLTDSIGNSLLGTPSSANSVQYSVDGQPAISSSSRALTLSPNLTVTVAAVGTTTVTVGQSTSSIANAISSFVTAYNSAQHSLTAQRGSAGGALTGQSVIDTLTQSLNSLTNYKATGTSSVRSMADLGLTFNDTTGTLSFNSAILSSAAANNLSGVTDFLGSASTGGFLQAATSAMAEVLDPTSGAITTELTSAATGIARDNSQIGLDQVRVTQLQSNLTTQLESADALIASLQQQNSYVTSLFSSFTSDQTSIANA